MASKAELDLARSTFKRATRGKVCVACPSRAQEAHHLIRRQVIERERENELDAWRPELAVPVCRRCHQRHTSAFRRLPRAQLPWAGILLVREWGLEWALDAEYGER